MRLVAKSAFLIAILCLVGFNIRTTTRVGDKTDRGTWLTTAQWANPAGKVLSTPGRIMDIAWLPNGNILGKSTAGLMELNPTSGSVVQSLAATGGSSMTGLLVSKDGKMALFSSAGDKVLVAEKSAADKWEWTQAITFKAPKVGGAPYPLGLAWIEDKNKAAVALSRSGTLAVVDIPTRTVEKEFPTDICPYGVAVSSDRKSVFVSCWSRLPKKGEQVQTSSGVPVPVTPGGRAQGGTLIKMNLSDGKVTSRAAAGLQPTQVALSNKDVVYVAAANSDQVLSYQAASLKVVKAVRLEPQAKIPIGTAPNALAFSQDQSKLFVACGGVNAVAVLNLPSLTPAGWIPTAWYPGGVRVSDRGLAIASIKGFGSRASETENRKDAYDWLTTLQTLAPPTSSELARHTRQVIDDLDAPTMRQAALRSLKKAKPVPVPARLGEPSIFRHLVYILKENRTYDQMFGDIPGAVGSPELCIFPKEVTPNHRALAARFGLLDNYYCNGVLSADGHAWSMEGQPTTYFERSFGGWARSYPFGDDPLAVSEGGYLWDDMVTQGITFRNFGEFDYTEPTKKESFKAIYDDFISGANKIKFTHKVGVDRLRKYTAPDYPGWNMSIPDVLRAEAFRKEFVQMEKTGKMPQFTIIYLPQDHASGDEVGMPTPRAHVADNDLALGRVVEMLSKSRFWKDMVIFVNEDDPGGGFDSVDGHRSIALAISPYSRTGVNSTFYSQASVLGTMRRILGLKPLTQMDARAPLMFDCFQAKPNFASYTHVVPSVPLDELNKTRSLVPGKVDLSGPDRADDALLAEKNWAVSKPGERFPREFMGAHGKGLAKRGLKADRTAMDEDEDDD